MDRLLPPRGDRSCHDLLESDTDQSSADISAVDLDLLRLRLRDQRLDLDVAVFDARGVVLQADMALVGGF